MNLHPILADATVETGSSAFGAAVATAVVGILGIVFRFSNTRDAAKDAAAREHIATLKEEKAAKTVELATVRAAYEVLIEKCAHVTGERDLLNKQHEVMIDTNQRQRLQLDAAQANEKQSREESLAKDSQIDEQVQSIDRLTGLLDTHGIPWRK